MSDSENDVQIEIKVDEDIASGLFSNFSNVSHSPEEFIFDYLFVHPTPPPGFGKLVSRIIMTPAHAKRLLLTLQDNIHDYESRFGEIEIINEISDVDNIQ